MSAFKITYSAPAIEDLDAFSTKQSAGLVKKIARLAGGLHGDIKRLKDFDPAYRLRMGDYRILFDMEASEIIIRRIKHRREAYD